MLHPYNNPNIEEFEIKENLMSVIKKRFSTYGYQQIRTPAFESYDMYSNITGTVSKGEMIKVIDPSGDVLVLRPDVTIPLTKMISKSLLREQRLFYIQDVYRQNSQREITESTQAGVECFGENSPFIDAEVIILAIHTLRDLGLKNFKIEVGHAGFFKEIIEQIQVTGQQLEQIKALIQSKNVIEMEPYLSSLTISTEAKEAIRQIPVMYGDPETVIQQAKELTLNENMENILQRLMEINELIKDYNASDYILFNLGLINHMNYYSGVIFQGFVGNVGMPVLMGGRYDHLGEQFSNSVPAIGFAFDVDLLLQARKQQGLNISVDSAADICIFYDQNRQKEALSMSYELRNYGYKVITNITGLPAKKHVYFSGDRSPYLGGNEKQPFTTMEELLQLLKQNEGEQN